MLANSPSPSLQRLARRLLALEATALLATGASKQHEVVEVCEKLRLCLMRFAGADGVAALLRRALVLARVEAPALGRVTLKPDGSLEGLHALADEADGVVAAAAALISHLLGLLVMFIGEPIVLRLVREAWPDILTVE